MAKSWKQFFVGIISYVVLLPVSLVVLRIDALANPATSIATLLAILVALLPVAPFVMVILALVAQVREQDEMKQRIHLEAVLITALLTAALTFSYGLLQASGLAPDLSFTFVAPFMIFVWGGVNAIVSRRYG